MNVLSLFDGMSCGQIALQRAGIEVDNYFASEIDKYAIKITQKNFPKTIQLGDINDWEKWNLPEIDLLIGGSPCQGFSRSGAGLNFEDTRSKLFFKFVDILKAYKPKYFLLENVKMKKEWQDVISDYLGVEPILINSSLVSAQNRERLYWTNIPNISQPEDKHIYLKDIVESGVVDREKSYCIDANYFKGGSEKMYKEKRRRQLVFHQSELRLMVQEDLPSALTERRTEKAKLIRKEYQQKFGKDFSPRREKELVLRKDNKMNCLTSSMTVEHTIIDNTYSFRKLFVVECERLQTVPDSYTDGVSNTQRYKMLGNGWTIDVIVHFFNNIKEEYATN